MEEASLQYRFQWSLLPGLHNLYSLPILLQGWSVWPISYGKSEVVILCYRRISPLFLSLSLSRLSFPLSLSLPSLTLMKQSILLWTAKWRDLGGETLNLLANSQRGTEVCLQLCEWTWNGLFNPFELSEDSSPRWKLNSNLMGDPKPAPPSPATTGSLSPRTCEIWSVFAVFISWAWGPLLHSNGQLVHKCTMSKNSGVWFTHSGVGKEIRSNSDAN